MIRQAVSTDDAPHAIGPYSQAIVANGFVFCSGTAGIDPATGVAPDGIEEQTELALRNLDAILTAAGASLATLVKTTIFYANVNDFASINAVYERYMPDPPPARSAPANVDLPRNLLISIDAIAVLPAGRPHRIEPVHGVSMLGQTVAAGGLERAGERSLVWGPRSPTAPRVEGSGRTVLACPTPAATASTNQLGS
jgi:2-iminobutanoate/2-iminopropanoate deaminase